MSAEETITETLKGVRTTLTEAEDKISGPQNDEGILLLLRSVRTLTRVVNHLAKSTGRGDERMTGA